MTWTRVSTKMLPLATQTALANKRIFITGGTGTFGKWLIREIKNIACEVVLLTRDATLFLESFPEFASDNISFIEGDIRNFDDPAGHFDYIIHAATPVVSNELSDAELTDIIVTGTKRVLKFAEQIHCQRLLYVSSGAVYGRQPPELDGIPETFPCNPTSTYGEAKRIAEDLCIRSQVDCVIARCFAFVGPDMPLDAHFAIGNFIGNCLKNEPIVIRGDGSPLRSYMYSSDLAEWLFRLMLDGEPSECYNVGSDKPISILDLAHRVRDCVGTEVDIVVLQTPNCQQAPESYVPCTRKARERLSLEMAVDLERSIQNTLYALIHKCDSSTNEA